MTEHHPYDIGKTVPTSANLFFKGFRLAWIALGILLILVLAGCGSSSSSNDLPPIEDALWIGIQGGSDGAWQEFISVGTMEELNALGLQQAATGGVAFQWDNGVLHISDDDGDGKYGLVVVMALASSQRVTSFALQTTVSELSSLDFNELLPQEESATLQVEVEEPTGFGSSYIRLSLHDDYEGISSGFTYSQSFEKPPGTYDLIVTRANSFSELPTHLEARRNLSLTDGGTLTETIAGDVFDVANALSGPYTIQVLNADNNPMDKSLYRGDVNLLTANHTEAELGDKSTSDNTDLTFTTLGALLGPEDVYLLYLGIEPDDASFISYFQGFRSEGNKIVKPPSDPLDGAFDSQTSGGKLLPGLTGTTYTDAIGYTTQYFGTAEDVDYQISMHVSQGRSAEYTNVTNISFFMPDLTSTQGWNSRWSVPDTAVMDYALASAQVGAAGIDLEDLINWYLGGTSYLGEDEWFASIAKFEYGEGAGGPL
ncbi:MAG: hypothetical protein JXK94_12945 [Deltaproteobacteria bacterium]|nr:hypothetical protein [Deltaproteobacteria bacterium]